MNPDELAGVTLSWFARIADVWCSQSREPGAPAARLKGMPTQGLTVLSAALLLLVGCGDRDLTATPTSDEASSQWRPIADSPLPARSGAVAVWTGSEMVVFGGDTGPPCPPGADCVGPTGEQVARDGAAYDPVTDSWRLLVDSPHPLLHATATWTGSEVVVLAAGFPEGQPNATLAYDPIADRWRPLNPPPQANLNGGAWDGERLLYWQSEERPGGSDWSLDPESGTWAAIGADPLGETFDRSYTWVGDRFVVAGLLISGVDNDESVRDVYQVAEYVPAGPQREEAWRLLPQSTVGFWDPRWVFHEGVLLNPSQEAVAQHKADWPSPGGQLDLTTGEWAPIPQTDTSAEQLFTRCQLPPVGSAGDWVAGGGPVLVSVSPPDTVALPACGELADPNVAVWTGKQLIVWGGPTADYRSNLNTGLAWTPPPPR